jgi:hypothetical protein
MWLNMAMPEEYGEQLAYLLVLVGWSWVWATSVLSQPSHFSHFSLQGKYTLSRG